MVEKKSKPEKTLDAIEEYLRKFIIEKKELKKKFSDKLKELEKQKELAKKLEMKNVEWFEENWNKVEKAMNELILLWDFWKREVEIFKLERKISSGILPSEREEIMKEIKKLNDYNITLEQGFKKRSIDPEIVDKIKKRLGIWEEKES